MPPNSFRGHFAFPGRVVLALSGTQKIPLPTLQGDLSRCHQHWHHRDDVNATPNFRLQLAPFLAFGGMALSCPRVGAAGLTGGGPGCPDRRGRSPEDRAALVSSGGRTSIGSPGAVPLGLLHQPQLPAGPFSRSICPGRPRRFPHPQGAFSRVARGSDRPVFGRVEGAIAPVPLGGASGHFRCGVVALASG